MRFIPNSIQSPALQCVFAVSRPRLARFNVAHARKRPLSSSSTASSGRTRLAFRSVEGSRPKVQLPPVSARPLQKPLYIRLTRSLSPAPDESSTEKHIVALDPTVFAHPIRQDIVHLCVVQYLDSLRQGSGNTKTRSEVRGSGRKLFRQKGTGKARVGDGQSPIRVGGGISFGPKPRDFSTKLPRKVIQMGMRVALSAKVKEQKFGIMRSLDWPSGKTNTLSKHIQETGHRQTLFVTGEDIVSPGLDRAIRKVPQVAAMTVDKLNVYELMRWPRLVLDLKAAQFLQTTYKKDLPLSSLAPINSATLQQASIPS